MQVMFQVQGYQGYQPLHQGYQPCNQGYQPSNQPYNQGYQPFNQGYQANNYESYQPTQSVCQRDDLQLSNEVSQVNHSDDLPLLNQNQINNFEEPYFCDDVVELTRLLIENLEHNLIPRSVDYNNYHNFKYLPRLSLNCKSHLRCQTSLLL